MIMNKVLTYQPKAGKPEAKLKYSFVNKKGKKINVYNYTKQIKYFNSQNKMKETIGDVMKQKGIIINKI